jgi:hypothetical protein
MARECAAKAETAPHRPRFLLPVKALGDRCRTLFRAALQKQRPEVLAQLPPKVWTQRWVTHSAAVGTCQDALAYLSRYVFKTATGNRQLQLLPEGRLRWPFRHSGTRAWSHVDPAPFEFIRRFLQHVLPSSFHRFRRFGWLHPAQRAKFNRAGALPLSTLRPGLDSGGSVATRSTLSPAAGLASDRWTPHHPPTLNHDFAPLTPTYFQLAAEEPQAAQRPTLATRIAS